MKPLERWAKFNLVGMLGSAVQLLALALFSRWLHGHYLWATAAAIELTLLHNFVWHTLYTWRDRYDSASRFRRIVRFHLCNGVLSVFGNLVLMRVLVKNAHLPLLLANGVAICVCSIANFCIGNQWAFAAVRAPTAVSECSPSEASCIGSG